MKTIAVFCVLVASALSGPVGKQFDWENVLQSEFKPQGLHEGHISTTTQFEGRITGGMIAIPHQFPYQVGLYLQSYTETEVKTTWCGASLITNRVVLTAAHCLEGVLEAVVFLGAQNIQQSNVGRVLQGVDYRDFIIHPEYDPTFSINDIALIKLPQEVVVNEYVQTINLPNPGQDQSSLENKLAVITGWGLTGDAQDVSMDLRYATLRILPEAACHQTYPYLFNPTQICVSGDNKKSVCAGDSGGPLVVSEDDGSKTVVGLVSFGRREGCEHGYPTVFTRVTSYLDWIAKNSGVSPKEY